MFKTKQRTSARKKQNCKLPLYVQVALEINNMASFKSEHNKLICSESVSPFHSRPIRRIFSRCRCYNACVQFLLKVLRENFIFILNDGFCFRCAKKVMKLFAHIFHYLARTAPCRTAPWQSKDGPWHKCDIFVCLRSNGIIYIDNFAFTENEFGRQQNRSNKLCVFPKSHSIIGMQRNVDEKRLRR